MRSKNGKSAGRLLRKLVAVAFVAATTLGFVSQALAKGPESVAISGSGLDQPVELTPTDNPDLVFRLMEQTGVWFATGDLPRAIAEPKVDGEPAYTLAWVNGGPPGKSTRARTIVQHLYWDAGGGFLIHTPEQDSLTGWGQEVIGWFAAPAGLEKTLAELGVPIPPAQPPGPSPLAIPESLQADPLIIVFAVAVLFAVGLAGVLGLRMMARARERRLASDQGL